MAHPIIRNDQVWCPLCKDYVHILKIEKAARLVDVSRRTIYCYIEEGKIHSFKIVGSTCRICSNCLFRESKMI